MFSLTPWKSRTNKTNGNTALARREDNPIVRLRDEFDTLFDRFFGGFPTPWAGEWGPWSGWGLDVEDEGDHVMVRCEAPGFEAGDFDVQVSGELLTIKAEHQQEKGKKGEQDYSSRRSSFVRSVTLPAGIMTDGAQASYRNGVLELRFAKDKEALPKKIEVKA